MGDAALKSAGDALQKINTAGQQAVQAVTNQQNASVQVVKDETKSYIEEKKQEISDKTDEVTQTVNQAGEKQLQKIANSLDKTLTEEGKAADSKVVGDALNTKITKFYASNQGETHIVDSDDGKIMDMMIYGRSEQTTTTGTQLCEITIQNYTSEKGVAFETSEDGSMHITGTARGSADYTNIGRVMLEAGKTYTITGFASKENGDIEQYFADASGNSITGSTKLGHEGDNGRTIVLNYTGTANVVFKSRKDIPVDITIRPVVNAGTEKLPWEPYTGGKPSPSPEYPQEIKKVVNPIIKVTDGDMRSNTAALTCTLNAIPVASGGNVTINGQQYISDYVDIERGKLVRLVDASKMDETQSIVGKSDWALPEPVETELNKEEVQVFKELPAYYPTTNIATTSDQLNGYTVFNYPINMKKGWDYIRQQINDNREYIYDMDAKTQDIEIQSAEAYVNSEYAVALTELEV